ncbi:tRNA1(Val) (adenine(37)-N6)-methyltransferase [Acetohalobium arabaticum]|uniref:Methyltransferase type 11 n=1 Tax=Acetohalobium arabaticum (strain ATCC 49924 / DSM 5501 / Z-7288) TaxID=574087 RepID=D9QSR1_ACEAZ|nr:tRNA1(Val) (adenine(37)-N6)-methyltransferase [Acetohalobium arabaticum]ADL11599.1 Methyltransferase type 11 [Acetohalobium arabaticum DSM 5501]
MSRIELKKDERLDDLIHSNLQIIQSSNHFAFAIDAVLLADFVEIKPKDRVIDLGTGTGVIPLLLTGKNDPDQIVGIEIQVKLAEMAQRSVLYNKLEDVIEIKKADIRQLKEVFAAESFDVVVSNPPYLPLGQGKVNPDSSIALARHELKVKLEDVVEISSYLVRYKGRVSYIYRVERLDELLEVMNYYNLQPKYMRLIQPEGDKACNLVLVTGIKGANSGLEVDKPLIIYRDNGEYTEEVLKIYYGEDYNYKGKGS